ncbi:MAG: VWA domain-containing protein [Promethearchaeota archaeon]
MQDYKIEDTVILLDTSRSMIKKDFKPNRLTVALKAAKNFIIKKLSIDPKDRIAIICFGDTTKKLISFTNEQDKLLDSFKRLQITGKGLVHEAISFALQLLVEEMRKIGGKIPRIFIISDDKLNNDLNRLQKILNIAKGLGVFIDTCQLGKTEDYKQSTLKRIAQLTGGDYGYFTNSKAVINAGNAFASKKLIKESTDYFGPSQDKNKPAPLISEVALSLRRPTIFEIKRMMQDGGRGQEKCQICHSIKSPITNKDFYAEGRYCPSCDRPMHLSCAGMWAKKSEYKENVFRCPFCFFLLRLPKSIIKLIEETDSKSEQKIQIIEEPKIKETEMIKIPDNEVEQIEASCSYCHSIFTADTGAYKCNNCGAYYHEPCLKKMYEEIKACRVCGFLIKNIK